MLTIRESQMKSFQASAMSRFIQERLRHVQATYPTLYAALGPSVARTFIESSIAAGKALRIRSESALSIWIDLRLEFGERFERAADREWAQNILAHPLLPDTVRLRAIKDRFRSRTGGRMLVPYVESRQHS